MSVEQKTSFKDAWYPALFSHELTDKEPYGIQILGYPLVFWRSKGKAVCALDACPHRSAPLSVGRIENGILECKYHGWQFNDKAECDYIPAQPDKKPTKANHCDSLPCIERYEAVWVWMAEEDSNIVTEQQRMAKFPDSLFKYYDDSSFIRNTGSRDLDIDHGLMIENLLDPAHLPFTHEGTLAKRSDAQLLEMDVDWNTCTRDKPPTEEEEWYSAGQEFGAAGFQTTAFRPNAEPAKKRLGSFLGLYTAVKACLTMLGFLAPIGMILDMNSPKFRMIQVHFNVPVTPTKMRIVFWFYRNVATFVKYIPGQNYLFQWMSDKIIEQDVVLLSGQQVRLRQGARAWNSAVRADTGGVLYRKWRDKAEKQKPWFKGFKAIGSSSGDMEDFQVADDETLFDVPATSKFQPRERLPFLPPNVRNAAVAIAVLLLALLLAWLGYLPLLHA